MERPQVSLPTEEQVIAAINTKQINTGADAVSVQRFIDTNFAAQGKQASAEQIAQAYLDTVVNVSM